MGAVPTGNSDKSRGDKGMMEGLVRIVDILWLLLKAGLLFFGVIIVFVAIFKLFKSLKEMIDD